MRTATIIMAILFCNAIFGCFVLAAIDKDESLFKWAKSVPILYPLVLELWFVILILWLRRKILQNED